MSAADHRDDFRQPPDLFPPQQPARPRAAALGRRDGLLARGPPRARPQPIDDGPRTVHGWPVHEPEWKREILRTEVDA